MNNVKNKIIHIIFKMIQTKTLWEKDYQQKHMKAGKAILAENEIGATEAAPMINAALKTSLSVAECIFFEEEHSFPKNSKKN